MTAGDTRQGHGQGPPTHTMDVPWLLLLLLPGFVAHGLAVLPMAPGAGGVVIAAAGHAPVCPQQCDPSVSPVSAR